MITKRMMKVLRKSGFFHALVLVFILGFIAGAPPWAHAQIPRYINYQGKLTDADSNPVTGDVSITVRLYDAASGGTVLWTETQSLTVTRGIFSILLGSTEDLDDLDFNDAYWYSVEIESDGEMTPRQRLTAVAYAINADKLDGYDASDFLTVDASEDTATGITISGGLITAGPNEDIELNPTGLGNIVMSIDSTSGDFKVTDGTTNWLLVDNETGNVTIANDLTVGGSIYGTLASTGGDNTFSSIIVTGTSNLRGNISNSTGAVTIADALTQTGSANQVTFAGNVDANAGVDVTGALTVSGATTLSSGLDMNAKIDLDYSGTSAALNVDQDGTGPSAVFTGGEVIIGDTTLLNDYINQDGELYVEGDLEVDGTIYGNIDTSGSRTFGDTTLSTLTVTGTSDLQGDVTLTAAHMYVAEDTSTGAKDSAATLYFGRNATDDWETIGYDPTLGTKGNFTFSAPLQVEASSPTGITFVLKDEEGNIIQSQGLVYDPGEDEFSFTGGKLKQSFQNLIRNGSFESYKPGGWENHNIAWGTNMDIVYPADNIPTSGLPDPRFGSKYVRFKDTDSTARGMRYRVDMPDRFRGDNLTMSVWARAASGTETASIGYSYTSGATDASAAKNISLTTTWQNFAWTFPGTVTDTANVVIYVYLYGAGVNSPDSDGVGTITGAAASSGYVYFDGITLVQGNLSLDYGPTPILDTGNQVIYGNLAIGANLDPVNYSAGGSPTLVFGEPPESFYYSGYGGWSMESGQISYEQLGGYGSGRFMFNKPIRIFPGYQTSWGAGFYLGEAGTVNYANNRTDAYIQGRLEVDGGIYGDGSNITNISAGAIQLNSNGAIVDDSGLKVNLAASNPGLAITSNELALASNYLSGSVYDSRFLNTLGDIMTGKLTINESATTTGAQALDINSTGVMASSASKTIVSISDSANHSTSSAIKGMEITMAGTYSGGSADPTALNINLSGIAGSVGTERGINITMGAVTDSAINTNAKIVAVGLDNNSGDISNAGAISGATTIIASSTITQLSSVGLIPEYDSATPRGDGSDNFGTLSLKYDNTHNYYEWTTSEPTAQDYDIVVRYRLPDGFSSFDSSAPIKLYSKVSDATGSTAITVTMLDTAGSTVTLSGGADLNNTSWTESTITIGGSPTFTAGGYVTIIVKLSADQGDTVDAGEMTLKGNW